MADQKISGMSDASSLTGTESVEIVQGGVNKKTTTQQIADLGSTTTPSLVEVLTTGNDASGLTITNVGTPVSAGDAANKQYVDSVVPGLSPNLGDVLAEGNDAGGVTITNLPAPSASSDAATKDYVDSVSSGSFHLADFTTITQASPTQVDCNSLKEPKFYLEVSSDTTLNITELRSDDTLSAYTTIYFRIRKKVAGDVVITLDSDYNNFDLASDATITAITLSGADEKIFWLTGIAYGLASSCDIAWNLVSTATGGGGGAVDSVNGQTGVVVLTAANIGNTATGGLSSTNVQASLAELDGDLSTHIASGTAHTAASISYSAGGTVSATNVQSAIAEVAAEKLPLAGGTMSGSIGLGGTNKITGSAAASANGELVRYEETRTTRTVTSASAAVQGDDNSLIIFNSASPFNFTLDQLTANSKISFLNVGAGAATFVAGTGVTITGLTSMTGAVGTSYPTAIVFYHTATTPRVVMPTATAGAWGSITGTLSSQTDLQTALDAKKKVVQLACSDETTPITSGTAKITFRMPYAMTVSAVRASLSTAQTSGSIFTVDINEGGSTILSTKLTIDNTEKTSTTAATAAVISDTSLADDAEITIDIDQVGDGTAKGLKVTLIGL